MQGRVEHKIVTEKKIQEKIKDMPDFITRFYYSLNQKSHTTKFRYINNVIRFLEDYTEGNIEQLNKEDLKEIDSFIIEQYVSKIEFFQKNNEVKEMSGATKACIYSSLNAFFSFLVINKYIDENPFANKRIVRPKIQETDITFLTPEEVGKVEQQIFKGSGNALAVSKQKNWMYRDYLLFRIPVVNGLRVTALSEINLKDINFKNQSIHVIEKGNISKDVYIDKKTCEYIKLWLRQRKEILDDEKCDALFISNQKKRMTVRSIEYVIKKHTESVVTKHITPHKLRSTCGTNLYQAKKDIYLVADVLGHKTTAPTKRYSKIFNQDKRDAINVVADLYN